MGASPLWLRVLLFASLAANLLVVGLVAGAASYGGGRAMAAREPGFGFFEAALDKADRAALRAAFLARAEGVRTPRREMRARMESILAALRADPYDPAALEAAMAAAAARAEARLAVGKELMVAHLSSLTPAARAAFADRLEAALRRGRSGDGRGGDGRGGEERP